jgi:hypothetical protein
MSLSFAPTLAQISGTEKEKMQKKRVLQRFQSGELSDSWQLMIAAGENRLPAAPETATKPPCKFHW